MLPLLSSGLEYPQQRVTVNLAPASVRKTGAGLELAVALALTCAAGGLPSGVLDRVAVLGELGLDGGVRPVVGTLALVDALARTGVEHVIVPAENAAEAAFGSRGRSASRPNAGRAAPVPGKGEAPWPDPPDPPPTTAVGPEGDEPSTSPTCAASPHARHALAVAAAGAHHLLMVGPPGVGKTMLARRLPTILAPLDRADALEVTKIHSAAGTHRGPALRIDPPFRQPHHSASMVSLVGGGTSRVRPGEVSLAHRGALFLDELPEFPVHALESLRQPLEERVVRVSRASGTIEFPADFLLVACANPCPCGRREAACKCGDVQRTRYARRLSAPLLDRFDLRIKVEAAGTEPGESSEVVAARSPWPSHASRFGCAELPGDVMHTSPPARWRGTRGCSPTPHEAWLGQCTIRQLTGRGAARIRRVARTVADLDDRTEITAADVDRAAWMREDLW